MENTACIAIDLGATSGRVIFANMSQGKLDMEILCRFPNEIKVIEGRYYWDIYSLFDSIKTGLRIAASRGLPVASIGVDTWGVDFVGVRPDGSFASLPRSYRDPYTDGVPEKYFEHIDREEVYRLTGIQFMNFNSLFQLYAVRLEGSLEPESIRRILFMPDAISYLLTGREVCEYTILSTSQLMNPRKRQIESRLLEPLGLSVEKFAPVVWPGQVIGPLSDRVRTETGLPPLSVIAVAGHDTASAVAAVPAVGRNFAYLSSGTWSLMGIETDSPVVTDEAYRMNFTNEGGIDGTTRFLKNITGLWLLEQCLKRWKDESGTVYTYPQLVAMAQTVEENDSYVDPDDVAFANPRSMPEAVADYCRAHGMNIPQTHAEYVRCILESLALKYRYVLSRLQQIAPFRIECVHVIGGGSQNELLNRFTAAATGVPVVAGPAEATALGNVLVQLRALGVVSDRDSMRRLSAASVSLKRYEPDNSALWNKKYEVFKRNCNLL
ncbi:rhamnulokinase family protein [Barnesiella sp. An55]|uniref:rhamnulokinase n=1 Tax=Barnesiella sp. An55 TaxID=1965646 RepID=UPI000B3A60E6|nr:rhamnulokinase family protein [Barnesiella sp. An55]OUN72078.1 rhamnulokinase [Barnesiella sp. An55]